MSEMDDDADDAHADVPMDHWEFAAKHHRDIRRLCRRACRGRHDLVDDMFSDLVTERLPAIYECWDPTMGVPPDKKAWGDLKWYAWKWMNRRMRTEVLRYQQLDREESLQCHRGFDQDHRDEVQSILEALDAYDAALLSMHLMCDMTFEEIAEALDLSKGTARNHYVRALARARLQLDEDNVP